MKNQMDFVVSTLKKTTAKKESKWKGMANITRLALVLGLFTFAGCGPVNTGDLIGIQGRGLWFHPQPIGTVYVPSGTYHSGQRDQDVFQSFVAPNKQVSIVAFWMDETEITNNEYRQFVNFVIDSIKRVMSGDEKLFTAFPDDFTGNSDVNNGMGFINYELDFDETQYKDELEELYYGADERFRGKKQIDVNQLEYEYQWFDYQFAANDAENQDKYQQVRYRQEHLLLTANNYCNV
jgi:formylglycine-generating enzyme required for sulfatase activity